MISKYVYPFPFYKSTQLVVKLHQFDTIVCAQSCKQRYRDHKYHGIPAAEIYRIYGEQKCSSFLYD